ncbi:MAG: bifunctional phosphopantothenoylcysteine decarboxylase/phosphopantothenate--cysteine ligase CoaBC [Rickettsiales bacterium]|jgi:phosphopantothenoylcysteine decarboxylase/phosphopantothenate--cysteine ligase|nr:bifunctional phosphopantothenoylcysteine decarboxylase/phosphopantothenate--cysteine ligase CoaBC [Rickettsiales bacterium]
MCENKNVLIGITGGIAAYKICEVVRIFKRNGANVKIITTENALQFVTKITLQTLSQNAVYTEEFTMDWKPEHVNLSEWADIFVIAPITANTIGKIAHGICDNLLTSVACTFGKKILVAPAMNANMWNNKIVQENVERLKKLKNFHFVGPDDGFLACNCNGIGRMSEPEVIFQRTESLLLQNTFLVGKRIIVTAGGTKEAIDPIRCITNHSSGKMGIAVADEAHDAGAEVILITTVDVQKPYKIVKTVSTIDILNALKEHFTDNSDLIMAASISDFRPENASEHKIKKDGDNGLTIKLIQNPDILKEIAKMRNKKQKIVGFCAETQNLVENALKKLKSKDLDFIAANDVSRKDIGFSCDFNEVVLIDREEKQYKLERDTKNNVARRILEIVFGEK